jgi:lysozyme
MNISQKAIDMVAAFEGLRLEAYRDPVGIPTIGYGTIRYPDGTPVRLGDEISRAEAEAYLMHELEEAAEGVSALTDGIALNQNQFDALVSFTYNVGPGAFGGSTLLKKLKEGDFAAAAAEFDRWNKGRVNGEKVVLRGLSIRRAAERALFERDGDAGAPIEAADTAARKTRKLRAYVDGDKHVVAALDEADQVLELMEFKGSKISSLSALLKQYPKAETFDIAGPGMAIPDGPRTELVLREEVAHPPAKEAPTLERDLLVRGVEDGPGDNDVAELQERLRDLGFYRGDIDGDFGRGTDQAVRAFQAQVFGAAEADGKVGPLTWAKLFADQPVQEPQNPGTAQAGLNYLYLTRTGRRDEHRLEVLQLALYKDGKFADSLSVCSGVAGRQNFRKGVDSRSGTFEPIPEGRWSIGNILWKAGKDVYGPRVWSNALGPVKIFLCYQGTPHPTQRRKYIEFHIDWNRHSGSPGSAGCVTLYDEGDFKILVEWLRTTEPEPRSLYVDWKLGTCPTPQLRDETVCTSAEFYS